MTVEPSMFASRSNREESREMVPPTGILFLDALDEYRNSASNQNAILEANFHPKHRQRCGQGVIELQQTVEARRIRNRMHPRLAHPRQLRKAMFT